MFKSTKEFIKEYKKTFENLYAFTYDQGTNEQQYIALGTLMKNKLSKNWQDTREQYLNDKVKQVYYFSMEFLPGRQLKSNAYNMGILPMIEAGIEELGLNIDQSNRSRSRPSFRKWWTRTFGLMFYGLVSFFLGIPGNGNGIRYQYGLFRQKFVDGYQVELPEYWLRNQNVWETRNDQSSYIVRFGGNAWLEMDHQGTFDSEI